VKKRICVLTAMPECIHGQRIFEGIFTQCQKYGCDVAVFATMTNLMHSDRVYQKGEEVIYQLPNFDLFDGVIIDTVTFGGGAITEALDKIKVRLRNDCHVPVVTLELPIDGCKCIENDNEPILREMCRHLTVKHGKRDICIITGPKGNPVADYRLSIFLDELSLLGVAVHEERIIYGDFWYSCGERLADEIAAGRTTLAEAYLCASDHMALGLIERLKKYGLSVPHDTIVIGFEATTEAALNDTPLTSFVPNDSLTAAKAVDYLRTIIEPDARIIPYETSGGAYIRAGESCGCGSDHIRSLSIFRDALYYTMRNYNLETRGNDIDIGLLMENYVSEKFTGVKTPKECLSQIWGSTYLLQPFSHYFLCLADDWVTDYSSGEERYPKKMNLIAEHSGDAGPTFCCDDRSVLFDTSDMLPHLLNNDEKTSVFYFSPVHFGDKTFGYSVLQRELTDTHKLNLVYRNWLRLVNNSLEMMRAKNRYMVLSTHDEMTGLLNRRGFYERLEKAITAGGVSEHDIVILSVDLDGLKKINDTYGHTEGDTAIITVGRALCTACGSEAVCARFGGDEFAAAVIVHKQQAASWFTQFSGLFSRFISDYNATSGKPYQIMASVGFSTETCSKTMNIEALINKADSQMYADKAEHKKINQ